MVQNPLPSSLKKNDRLPFIEFREFNASACQPLAQICDQPDFLPAILMAIALPRNQSGKTVNVWPQRTDTHMLQLFWLGIKTINHKCVSFPCGLKL
jgi:hypothetical protein